MINQFAFNSGLRGVVLALAAIGLGAVLFVAVIVVLRRGSHIIRAASLPFCLTILFGIMLAYIHILYVAACYLNCCELTCSVVCTALCSRRSHRISCALRSLGLVTVSARFPAACNLLTPRLAVSFAIVFSALYVKIRRVALIFRQKIVKKITVR